MTICIFRHEIHRTEPNSTKVALYWCCSVFSIASGYWCSPCDATCPQAINKPKSRSNNVMRSCEIKDIGKFLLDRYNEHIGTGIPGYLETHASDENPTPEPSSLASHHGERDIIGLDVV